MEDLATDNQTEATTTTEDGAAASKDASGSITDIMAGMAGETAKADVKPNTSGEKTEAKSSDPEKTSNLPAWTSQLPDELKNNSDTMKQLSKFNKIGDLAKSYSELEKKLGTTLVKPGDDASEEEKQAFYGKLGKPKSADGYEIDGEDAKDFKELAFKNNLSNEQAKGVFNDLKNFVANFTTANENALKQQAAATEKSLRDEYGPKYPEKLEMLKRGVTAYGGPQLATALKNAGLLSNEIVVRHFIKLGEMNAEAGTFNKGNGGKEQYKSTADGGSFTFKGL